MPKDEIYHLTAEVAQCLIQKDFEGAEYAIRQFVNQRSARIKALQRQIDTMKGSIQHPDKGLDR